MSDEGYKRVTVPLTIVDNGEGAGYLRLMWPDGSYVKVYEGGSDSETLYDALRATLDAAPAPEAPKTLPRPTIGRIVHVVTTDGQEHAALIVGVREAVGEFWCDLAVFFVERPPMGPAPTLSVELVTRVLMSDKPTPGCWHWPEREGA